MGASRHQGDSDLKKDYATKADGADLRRRAEEKLIKKRTGRPKGAGDRLTAVETQRLVQELQIHQIELEMQNEELTRARDEAESERERYLDLYDFAPVGYLSLDSDGVIRQANLTGARLLGMERSRLLNRRFGQFISAADGPAFNAFLKKVFENRGKESCTVSLGHEGNQRTYVHIEATVTGDGGECRTAVLDVTQRKIAEDEVERLREAGEQRSTLDIAELNAANKDLDAFCYSISHDLQAPLRAIDGYSRMILKKDGDRFDEDTRTKFTVIRKNTQKMGQLINDFLAFARLGRRHLSVAAVDMGTVVKEVWEELRVINPGKSMTLKVKRIPSAMADRALIRQVLGNILSNAVKFAGSRDEIIVDVGGHREGSEIVYSVKDNGIGFNMAYYDKLFGIFQRLHNPDEYEGTGVGLAITQRIVSRHGGRVWAEGEVDRGAIFYFSLPAK
jgi:PAS domain S-box-containing protein